MTVNFPPSVVGAVLLAARVLAPHRELWPLTVEETLALVGAGKSQAYEVLGRLWKPLASLLGRPGRPSLPPERSAWETVGPAYIRFLTHHPGAVCAQGERCTYNDGVRRFVVGLTAPGQPGETLSANDLARGLDIPLGTLKGWLFPRKPSKPATTGEADLAGGPGGPALAAEETPNWEGCDPSAEAPEVAAGSDDALPEPASAPEDPPVSETIRDIHLRLIAALWPTWKGTFEGFCQILHREHRIPFGNTFIAHFLEGAGLRSRRPRPPAQAPWSHQTFRTLFPGAQWLGDGTSIAVHWEDRVFVFNVEAILDSASNALLGFHVSDAEDEETLLLAYRAALETAGAAPLSFTLDNRPSNHTPAIQEAVEGTVLRATLGRGQAKAALEGAFGLFQQSMPPFILTGQDPRGMARSALQLVFLAWARGRNGRPRRRLDGRTPAEAYTQSSPTQEETQRAVDYIRQLQRREEQARRTREARRDPIRLQLLDQGLAELGIPDPGRRLAVALAGYAPEAIVRGLATFQAKKALGTLPAGADPGRYLGGIIRNLSTKMELDQIAGHLLEQRIRLRDITLEPLHRKAARLRAELHPNLLPQAYVDQALETAPSIDFRFWARVAAEALSSLSPEVRKAQYRHLCRRIAASFGTERDRRGDLIDRLAEATALAA